MYNVLISVFIFHFNLACIFFYIYILATNEYHNSSWGRCGRDHMVVGFTTTYKCLSPLML